MRGHEHGLRCSGYHERAESFHWLRHEVAYGTAWLEEAPDQALRVAAGSRPPGDTPAAAAPRITPDGGRGISSSGRKFHERREGGEAGTEREEHPFLAGLWPAAVQDLPQDKQNGG